ncbi:MAG: hypothetical protein R3299_08865, partial [Arenibacter sp.]|nr:hypothetical protein [Arenibacter sp.]
FKDDLEKIFGKRPFEKDQLLEAEEAADKNKKKGTTETTDTDTIKDVEGTAAEDKNKIEPQAEK